MSRNFHSFLLAAALFASTLSVSPAHAQATPGLHPASVQDGAYTVEPNHTRVLFSVSHMGFTTWYGDFTGVSGSLDLNPKTPARSTLEIHIPVGSVTTINAKLDGELKSAEWLDAAQFPDIVFKARNIAVTGETSAKVTGDLTFHGVTKPVTLDARFNGAGINPLDRKYTVGFEVSGTIKRSDFGVKTYVPLIGDEVTLTISAAFEHS